jgi:hypothetical protein
MTERGRQMPPYPGHDGRSRSGATKRCGSFFGSASFRILLQPEQIARASDRGFQDAVPKTVTVIYETPDALEA